MMKYVWRIVLLLCILFFIGVPPCWAKSKGYLYAVSYSIAQKKMYMSKVIVQKVRSISYSDEEFVAEVELIQKMEARFLNHLVTAAGANPSAFTTTVRGPYKSRAIADRRLKTEIDQFTKKGYSTKSLNNFEYGD